MFGVVRWFRDDWGYGFIRSDDDGEPDVFVHHSAIQMRGRRTLVEDQRVEFDVQGGPKGLEARDVRIVG